MIIRTLPDSTVVHIHVAGDFTDQEFLDANPTGGFSSVDSLPESKWNKWKVVDNVIVVDTAAETICENNMYKDQRVAEYPAIGDQLDALYHAGVFPADMTATLKAVKDKYPKS